MTVHIAEVKMLKTKWYVRVRKQSDLLGVWEHQDIFFSIVFKFFSKYLKKYDLVFSLPHRTYDDLRKSPVSSCRGLTSVRWN